MAKELPYFRFTCQEWDTGDISLEPYAIKGFFMDVSSYYWSQNCLVLNSKLTRKFPKQSRKIKILYQNGLIKKDGDYMKIKYLDAQLYEFVEKSKKLSSAGKKGAEIKERKRLASLKPPLSIKDKDKDKDKDKGKKQARARNEIWDSVCELWGLDPKTKNELSSLGGICRDLKLKGATPESIKTLKDLYESKWANAASTPRALLKNWDIMKNMLPKEKPAAPVNQASMDLMNSRKIPIARKSQ